MVGAERRRDGVGRLPRVARVRARRARRAGRSAAKDPRAPQVPIIEHADVRRMLLRQKAIVEGGLALVRRAARATPTWPSTRRCRRSASARAAAARSADADREDLPGRARLRVQRARAADPRRLRLLERVPARGVAARSEAQLASTRARPASRALDLLGRKVVAEGGRGAAPRSREEIEAACARARRPASTPPGSPRVRRRAPPWRALTAALGARGLAGDVDGMLLHSADYLELFSIRGDRAGSGSSRPPPRAPALAARPRPPPTFYEGKLAAAQYWLRTELPRIAAPRGPLPRRRGQLRPDAAGLVLSPSDAALRTGE